MLSPSPHFGIRCSLLGIWASLLPACHATARTEAGPSAAEPFLQFYPIRGHFQQQRTALSLQSVKSVVPFVSSCLCGKSKCSVNLGDPSTALRTASAVLFVSSCLRGQPAYEIRFTLHDPHSSKNFLQKLEDFYLKIRPLF